MVGAQDEIGGIPDLPAGVLTVMFTDLEDSTNRWELEPTEMRRVMDVHDDVIARAVTTHDGVVFKSTGDGVGAVFASPRKAVAAAVMMQRQLQNVPWPARRPRVRIGLHLGDLTPTRGDYYGAEVNRAARIMDAANGDQITMSGEVAAFLEPHRSRPCGNHHLRGIGPEAIHLVLDPAIHADDRPLRAPVESVRRRLPSAISRSIGRTDEVDAVVALLAKRRSVTIVGAGGVGKTHLALEIGRAMQSNFADGGVLVELDALRDGAAVLDQVAATLGARMQPGLDLLSSVMDYLEDREVLIILDNCEHVADAVRPVLARLVEAPGVTILATSRASLGSPGEQVFPLSPLQITTDAADLFIERAIERDPNFVLGPSDRAAIEAICARVDGIPLGVELAAAWVRVFTPSQIEQRLEHSFDVGVSAGGGRQHTLRSTITWSYSQLEEREAILFDRLSVLSGGFSLAAVAEICAGDDVIGSEDVADLVMALVDKSMIAGERAHGQVRFTMLRTLQHFAAGRLEVVGDAERFKLRHARHFASVVAKADEDLVSPEESEVWIRLDLEWSNIRTAFEEFLRLRMIPEAARMLFDLGWYSTLSLRAETFAWAEELLATGDTSEVNGRASLYGLRAINKYFTVDPDSRSDAEIGLEIDPSDPHGYCRIALGAVWVKNQHEAHESHLWTADWLASLTEESPMMSRLWALGMRAFHLSVHDPDSHEASQRVAEIEAIAATTGSPSASALAHWARGMRIASTSESAEAADGAAALPDLRPAVEQWRRGLDVAASLSDLHLVAQLTIGLELHFTAPDGDLDSVLRACHAALMAAHDHHYLAGTSHLFGVTAIVLTRAERADVARRLVPVMIANGHNPRQNAIEALGLDAPPQTMVEAETVLSIHEAAALAKDALVEAIEKGRDPGRTTLAP